MNDRRVTPEDDLRVALAPDDTIAPLDPARVIAGAHRRRKVRALAAAGIASVAVISVAAGGFLAAGEDSVPQPADPGVIDPTVDSTPRPTASTESPPATPRTPGPSETPGAGTADPEAAGQTPVPLAAAACIAAANGEPGPGPEAKEQGALISPEGRLIVVADGESWMACDNTAGSAVSARKPAELRRPSLQDTDAFAVANNQIEVGSEQREFFWAAGMLPSGVTTVRYSFADGESVDAEVSNGFWMMRHGSSPSTVSRVDADRIRVRLLSATGDVLKDFRLSWGTQTCAQISHGC